MVPPNLVTFPVIIQHPEVGICSTPGTLTFSHLRRQIAYAIPVSSFLVDTVFRSIARNSPDPAVFLLPQGVDSRLLY